MREVWLTREGLACLEPPTEDRQCSSPERLKGTGRTFQDEGRHLFIWVELGGLRGVPSTSRPS